MKNEIELPDKKNYIDIKCPVCNSEEYKILFSAGDYEYDLPGIFYVSKCNICGLLYQNPRPELNEILKYYTENYEPYNKVDSGIMAKLRENFLVKPRIKKYKEFNSKSAKVLDVGCSTGGLLEILNKYTSWELYGVEPDKKSSSIAKKKGLNIYNGLLETYNPEQKFDMIILNHVLEHLPDPAKTIQKVNLLLKDNGVLVGEIPTCDCFERIIFGRYWQGYHLPRHLTWFSKTLLKQFLENNGFTNISIHMQAQPSCWQVSLRNYFTAKGLLYEKRKILNGHNIFLFLLSAPIIVFFLFFKQSNIIKFSALKQ